jgi:two-component system response regulator HydG
MEIVRVGSNDPVAVDARVVAATNRPLRERVAEGTFRADLYFRLNVVRVRVPPLRERVGDVALLTEAFLDELAQEHRRPRPKVEPGLLRLLAARPWPGNVRELRNCLETMLLTAPGPALTAADLAPEPAAGGEGREAPPLSMRSIADVERELIANTLQDLKGNRSRAAEALGISTRTLYRRIRELGLS